MKYIVFTGGLTHVVDNLDGVLDLFLWEFTKDRRVKVNGKITEHSYTSQWSKQEAFKDVIRSGVLKTLLGVTIYRGWEI